MAAPNCSAPAASWRRLLTGVWLLSLVLVILTLVTPLEFNPLLLGNLARWLVWGLAFPVGRWVARRGQWHRWVGCAIPGLLWGGVVGAELLVAWDVYRRPASAYHRHEWRRAVWPLEAVFANQAHRMPPDTLFRRGRQVVAHQLTWERPWGVSYRYVVLAPVLPGLQWAQPLPDPEEAEKLLDTSWQLVDTASVGMSQDTALQRRVRPWVSGQRYTQRARATDAWRARRGLPRSNAAELSVPATQSGANMLSCTVTATGSITENSFWTAPRVRQGHNSRAVYRAFASPDYGAARQLTIYADLLFNGQEYGLAIDVANVRGPGTYRLAEQGGSAAQRNQLLLSAEGVMYTARQSAPAIVTITTLDTARAIIAGTFAGTLHNGMGKYTVIIEHGRFDLHYRRCEPTEQQLAPRVP